MSEKAGTTDLPSLLGSVRDDDPVVTRILDAAFEQFLDLGFRRSSMDDIAHRAGLGRTTVYRRYRTKNALIQAFLARELQRFLAGFEAATAPFGTAEEQVAEGVLFTLRTISGHPLYERLSRIEPDVVLPFLTVEAAPLLTTARDFLAGRLRGLPRDDARNVAEIMVRLAHSVLLTPLPFDERDARAWALRYFTPLLQRGAP